MKNKYEVIYLPVFYSDLDRITNYIKYTLRNKIAANKLLDDVYNSINKRANHPTSYEEFQSENSRVEKYYRIYVKNYIVFYVVKDGVMEVRRIVYGASDLEKIDYDI